MENTLYSSNYNTCSYSAQRIFDYEIRSRFTMIPTETGTKGTYKFFLIALDQQTVQIVLRLLFKPDPEFLWSIHKEYGYQYDEKILPSIGNEVLKAVVVCSIIFDNNCFDRHNTMHPSSLHRENLFLLESETS